MWSLKASKRLASHRSVGVVATLNLLERWRAGEPMRALGVPHKGREYTECATFSQLFSLVDGLYASVRCMNMCVRVTKRLWGGVGCSVKHWNIAATVSITWVEWPQQRILHDFLFSALWRVAFLFWYLFLWFNAVDNSPNSRNESWFQFINDSI